VWGQIIDVLEANTNTIRELCLPNSLNDPKNKSRIPRTILDAMTLTKVMDINFLWVDRLCIIQNDASHFNEQVHQMAGIFANAYFTIIAADGPDASYGLRGTDAQTSPCFH
jgi:hypothetical protein